MLRGVNWLCGDCGGACVGRPRGATVGDGIPRTAPGEEARSAGVNGAMPTQDVRGEVWVAIGDGISADRSSLGIGITADNVANCLGNVDVGVPGATGATGAALDAEAAGATDAEDPIGVAKGPADCACCWGCGCAASAGDGAAATSLASQGSSHSVNSTLPNICRKELQLGGGGSCDCWSPQLTIANTAAKSADRLAASFGVMPQL